MDRNFVNVLMLGFGFMFLFTSFQTMGNIEKTIIDSIASDDPNFHGDGYTSLAIIYGCLAVCNWLSPSALSLCGPRGAMVIGSLTYLAFMVSFLWPQTWLLYAASALLGVGAALIWTGQGTYLSRCSNPTNISRNSGVFWAMLQASMFLGNLFVYFQFQGKTHIDAHTRRIIFAVLISVAIVGVIFLGMLKRSKPALLAVAQSGDEEKVVSSTGTDSSQHQSDGDDSTTDGRDGGGVLQAFRDAVRLFTTKEMLLLSVTFLYTGLELSFFSGVYSPSIGFTLAIGDNAKQLVGLSGICIGIGEVSGGVLFGLLGSNRRFGRDLIAVLGLVLHLISFALIFVNLPDVAPFGDTNDVSFMRPPSVAVALLCSVMLGFGDACFNTQIYSMLGGVFARQSAAAFAIFKFTQSLAAAASFVYSSHVGLNVQIVILTGFGVVGTVCFCVIEWAHRRREAEGAEEGVGADNEGETRAGISAKLNGANQTNGVH